MRTLGSSRAFSRVRPTANAPRASRQPENLVSARGALIAIALAFAASWPVLLVGGPLAFSDTEFYHAAGHEAVAFVGDTVAGLHGGAETGGAETGAIGGQEPGPSQAGDGDGTADGPGALRSITFSVYMYVFGAGPFGGAFAALPIAAATLFVLLSLSRAGSSVRVTDAIVAGALCAALTTLPWFASYAMPDILAAAVILYAAALVRPVDRLSGPECLALAAIAVFAILCHYGNIALALGAVSVALLLRAAQSRLSRRVLLLGLGPIMAAVAINASLSIAAFGEPSIAPKRWPILLARSIADGPARWHLEAQCDARGYAVCELFDDYPDDFLELMWAENGFVSADEDLLRRIRQEEFTILWRAFLEHPTAQISSFAQNAARQFTMVGLDDHFSAQLEFSAKGHLVLAKMAHAAQIDPVRDRFDWLLKASALASLLMLTVFAAFGRLNSREAEVISVVLAGLLLNAMIFGGLAIPADRFQGRVAWVLPAVLAILVLDRRADAARRDEWAGRMARLAGLRERADRDGSPRPVGKLSAAKEAAKPKVDGPVAGA